MRVFKLKKGGETENTEEVIIMLSREIDRELIMKAINICAERNFNIAATMNYLDEQFHCIEDTSSLDLETFYC